MLPKLKFQPSYMQSNKVHKVFFNDWVLFITYVSSTYFGPHRSIIRSVLQAVFADLVCGTTVRTTRHVQPLRSCVVHCITANITIECCSNKYFFIAFLTSLAFLYLWSIETSFNFLIHFRIARISQIRRRLGGKIWNCLFNKTYFYATLPSCLMTKTKSSLSHVR